MDIRKVGAWGKLILCGVATAGCEGLVGTLCGNVISSSDAKWYKKLAMAFGGSILGGIAAKAASDYVCDEVDDICAVVEGVMNMSGNWSEDDE